MSNRKTNLGLKQRITNADRQERAAIIDGLPYQVGFGKPPQSTRFKAGNIYGRRGRPKGAENLHTILAEEFEAAIGVNEAGRKCKLSKRRVAVRQLANKVAAGDLRAIALYFDLMRKMGQLGVPPQKSEAPLLDARDREAIERLSTMLGTEQGLAEDSPPETVSESDPGDQT